MKISLLLAFSMFTLALGIPPPMDFRKVMEARIEAFAPGTYNKLLSLPQGFGKTLELLTFLAYVQEAHKRIDEYAMEQKHYRGTVWPKGENAGISRMRLY